MSQIRLTRAKVGLHVCETTHRPDAWMPQGRVVAFEPRQMRMLLDRALNRRSASNARRTITGRYLDVRLQRVLLELPPRAEGDRQAALSGRP